MGGPNLTNAPPQTQPQQNPPGAAPTAAPTANADAARQAQVMRALTRIPESWRRLCGSLLLDTDPPVNPPPVAQWKFSAYEIIAKPDGTHTTAVQEVSDVLGLYPSRKAWFDALVDVDRSAAGDRKQRDTLRRAMENLAQGGAVTENTERIMAAYGMMTTMGRDWLRGPDATAWMDAFAAYVGDHDRVFGHANYGESVMWDPVTAETRSQGRQNALKPLLLLLRTGSLAAPKANAAGAQPTLAAPTVKVPTEEEKKAWADQAEQLKKALDAYLPDADPDSKDKIKHANYKTQKELEKKVADAPREVRDLLFADPLFMRRLALSAAAMGGRAGTLGGHLMNMVDPVEELVTKCGVARPGDYAASATATTPAQRYELIAGYFLAHPGEDNVPVRMRVMSNQSLAGVVRGLSEQQQSDLWRLATRGTLAPTAEDRVRAAVRTGDAAEAARALLAIGGEERKRMQALQDDLLFRSAMEQPKMRTEVDVDGIKLRPYNMIMLMWGLRLGASNDPGAVTVIEQNPDENTDPLTVDERRKLDTLLYEPAVSLLAKLLKGGSSDWAVVADLSVDDSDVVDALESFRQHCADEKTWRPLIRRGGEPPGKVLSERFNARTGKNIRDLINRGLGADSRRRAETALQVTQDQATVGVIGNEITRAGEGKKDAAINLDQAIGETKCKDGRTVSQVVHSSAETLKSELHESEFWNGGGDVSDCKTIWDNLRAQVTDAIIADLRSQTKTMVYLIELLKNAYAKLDGPLIKAMQGGLQLGEQMIILPYYGLDGFSQSQREQETKTQQQNQEDPDGAARKEASELYAEPARLLFEALAGLDSRSENSAFDTARDKLERYRNLAFTSKATDATKVRKGTETPPDAAAGAKLTVPGSSEDFYRLHYGLTL